MTTPQPGVTTVSQEAYNVRMYTRPHATDVLTFSSPVESYSPSATGPLPRAGADVEVEGMLLH